MCYLCDYEGLLNEHGLDSTPNRLGILEIIGNSSCPLSAREIYDTISRTQEINRVTVYRILDLLVENRMAERISVGDRSCRYGLAPNKNHPAHPHFYCRHCGSIECLGPESLKVTMDTLERTFPGLIEKTQVRLDGICKNCLNQESGLKKGAMNRLNPDNA